MKRVLIGLMVLILALSLTGAAFATEIPKKVCFGWGGAVGDTYDVMHLYLKNIGSTPASTGETLLYSVNGYHRGGTLYSFPVTGTAYLQPAPSNVVHMSLTGTTFVSDNLYTFVYEIFWDYAATADPVGTVRVRAIADLISPDGTDYLRLVDCAADPVAFGADSSIPTVLEQLIKK
jgi:hypothetical protein